MRRILILLLTVGLGVAACNASDDDNADGVGVSNGETAATVTLVTHDSFLVSDSVLEEFTEDTGIGVEIVPAGDAGSALSQVILTKDDPIGDAFFGVDTTFLSRALDEDIFAEYESSALDEVPDELEVDPHVTPVDHGDVCINYDRAAFTDTPPPTTLTDLTDPAYAGRLVVENPASSSPGLAFALATIAEFGEDGWLDYWEELRANDVLVVDGWEQAYNEEFSGGPNAGPRSLVVSYASSPPASVDPDAEPLPDQAPIGTVLGSCFRQVEYVGVLEGAAHPEAARRLVDFMLSPTFQADVASSMYVFPVRTGVELPDLFDRYAELPDDPYTLEPDEITPDQREEWIEQWTDAVVR